MITVVDATGTANVVDDNDKREDGDGGRGEGKCGGGCTSDEIDRSPTGFGDCVGVGVSETRDFFFSALPNNRFNLEAVLLLDSALLAGVPGVAHGNFGNSFSRCVGVEAWYVEA